MTHPAAMVMLHIPMATELYCILQIHEGHDCSGDHQCHSQQVNGAERTAWAAGLMIQMRQVPGLLE